MTSSIVTSSICDVTDDPSPLPPVMGTTFYPGTDIPGAYLDIHTINVDVDVDFSAHVKILPKIHQSTYTALFINIFSCDEELKARFDC